MRPDIFLHPVVETAENSGDFHTSDHLAVDDIEAAYCRIDFRRFAGHVESHFFEFGNLQLSYELSFLDYEDVLEDIR